MPRICFWSTSFQADNQALACFLAAQPGWEVWVAMDHPEAYEREPVSQVLPFRGRLLDRQAWSTRGALRGFAPDLLVIDNHLPSFQVAPRLMVLWHGFGWRVDDLESLRKELQGHIGDVSRPNPNFRWVAFGEWDRDYRIRHSLIAPENLWTPGSAYSDILRPESQPVREFERTSYQSNYSIDLSRKIVTLGLTWHHGSALGHWGNDRALTEAFLDTIGQLGASVLLRMHDRFRYEPAYLSELERIAARFPHVQLKFKSESPDSLIDLLLSDVLVSNYSSLLNPFYHTQRATVHVDPSDAPGTEPVRRILKRGRVRVVPEKDPSSTWKLSPDQIGGLRARSFEELCGNVRRALEDPRCCVDASREFVARYATPADGHARQRTLEALVQWLSSESASGRAARGSWRGP